MISHINSHMAPGMVGYDPRRGAQVRSRSAAPKGRELRLKTARSAKVKARQAGFATPPVERIQHETLQKRVYGQLRTAFLESRFMPGQTQTLRALADMTGTSVQPVREALQRLCAEGALDWLPNTAFRVP